MTMMGLSLLTGLQAGLPHSSAALKFARRIRNGSFKGVGVTEKNGVFSGYAFFDRIHERKRKAGGVDIFSRISVLPIDGGKRLRITRNEFESFKPDAPIRRRQVFEGIPKAQFTECRPPTGRFTPLDFETIQTMCGSFLSVALDPAYRRQTSSPD